MSGALVLDAPLSSAPPFTPPARQAVTGPTMWGRLVSWLRCITPHRHGRSLARARAVARLALGERMYAAGIDDGETGARIAALDQAIRWADARAEVRPNQRAEREQLVLRLADAALEDDTPLPGAEAEYAIARQVLADLRDGNR